MAQALGGGPTSEEPDPEGSGEDQGVLALIRLVELLVLWDDSNPAVLVTAGLLWAFYLLRAAKHE